MAFPRLQLFELEDQPWFPRVVRDLATDYLRFIEERFRLHLHALPLLIRALRETGENEIVDCCSGGGGPILEIDRELRAAGLDVRFTLTDLYPNLRAFGEANRESGGRIRFVEASIDARRLPAELPGLRTFFNAFHHFGPEDAGAILADASRSGRPIAIFEIPERSVLTLVPLLLTPLFVGLATPWIRPWSWRRAILTYLIPVVPLTCLWDGVVSQLRAYRPHELASLARSVEAPDFVWETGTHRAASVPGRLTYLLGRPVGGMSHP